MNDQDIELLEKIRQQFDTAPYPCNPLEDSPKDNHQTLFLHSLVTPYYLKSQRFLDTKDKVILDAGCGTGYKSLVLAEANPGAKIIGIDLSKESINLAQKRFQFHGLDNAEFHVLSIYDLPRLGLEFDYINCDEVLYLFPDLAAALGVMRSTLKPQGIIRGNLHSALQRVSYFRAQEVFEIMGLMDSNPEEMEIEIAVETMQALKDKVILKLSTWSSRYSSQTEGGREGVLMNYLFQGDKGYTVSDLMSALGSANLQFINMVNWQLWEVSELFQEPNHLPEFWKEKLPKMSIEQRLEIFELLQPMHRLLDFWCTRPDQSNTAVPICDWRNADWEGAIAYLHPVLKTAQIKSDLIEATERQQPFEISQYIPSSSKLRLLLDSGVLGCLLPLWDEAQSVTSLVERWLKLRPLNPATSEPTTYQEAFDKIKQALSELENPLYVILERSA
ncbi:class I SAM-dependent methyltransferase [Phormidesmis priestleyi]